MSVEVEHMDAQQALENGDFQDGEIGSFGNESGDNEVVKENRVFKKAKRLIKRSPSKEETAVSGAGSVNGAPTKPLAFSKNSRKSRNGYGRGEAKKGGAGGKGVWGKLGDELYANGVDDEHDPNYDSDSTENVVIKKVDVTLDGEQLEKAVEPIILEYLEHGQTGEVLGCLEDLVIPKRHKVPELAVSLAMEHHNPQRELTSRLISDLYGDYLNQDQMARSFDNMLNTLSDLTLDTPEAPQILGKFIARAVADDCLPPKFVSSYRGKVECEHARSALDKADLLLGMKHGIVRLDNVWGEGGGNRPVKYLVKRMNLLLKEYLSSGDIDEATRCLLELDVPHFHHELVYEAVLMAIEESKERATDMMVQLLKSLCTSVIITPNALAKGVQRIFDSLQDISLDVPAAYSMLENMGTKMHSAGILPESLYQEFPGRGRKRFISEGDGGLVKNSNQ